MDLAHMLITFSVFQHFFKKNLKFRNLIIKQRKYQNLKPISKSILVNMSISEDTAMSSL